MEQIVTQQELEIQESLRGRVMDFIRDRRQRILEGKTNCILSPFKRFREDFSGIEQDTYYCVTSFTKGSKSQFTSYTFIYKPLLEAYRLKDTDNPVDIKILYFSLEETPERIMQRFMSFLLFEFDGIRISPKDLRSTTEPVAEVITDLLNTPKYADVIDYFEQHVIFSNEANPTGKLTWNVKNILYLCKNFKDEKCSKRYKRKLYRNL